ncbi:MAG: glutamate-1-semialdehyde 2,1-aminomutase [Candidatus Omnitrophica bacterium]|nr:glutamate-1-semialdehyde 2,1-aminomutase [Candidatus Omnitrophota bacterium]
MSRAWAQAQKHLVGGVNSPVRAFKAVGGRPVFFERARGPYLVDTAGKAYVDFCLSWGALLMGHAYGPTVRAVQKQALKGLTFGAVTPYETELAREIKKAFPGMQKIRFTSSGTEAVMSALRLARGVTKKNRIVKFEGGYHGHSDSLLVKAGSGLATLGTPDSAGVPGALAELTSVLAYNDEKAAIQFFKKHRDIACVIVEPVAGNMGVIPAKKAFLETLRALTKKSGAWLIFDEVISGYRVCYGGAQHLYGIDPDLTILGKVIGGGLPVGAFGGRAALMNHLSPLGNVYQAGTLSGNPLSMAAGLSVLSALSETFYRKLNRQCEDFLEKALGVLKNKHRTVSAHRAGSMFTLFFLERAPQNFQEVSASDKKAFRRFFHRLLAQGIYFPPSPFEASFLSAAHRPEPLQKTLRAFEKAC